MAVDAPVSRSLGASLLFPANSRLTAGMLARLFDAGELTGIPARVCHRSADGNCLEILASGLTIEMRLRPGGGSVSQRCASHVYGFTEDMAPDCCDVVEIAPGRHIAAGGRLLPIIETIAGLTANIALNLPVAAVEWHTAGTCMEPRFFSQSVLNWLAGGRFPALGLTALEAVPDSSVASKGLGAITGQEMRLAGTSGESPEDSMRTAARVVDYLVRNGRLTAPREISGPGLSLLAEPSQYGDVVWVWRK